MRKSPKSSKINTFSQNKLFFQNKHTFFGLTKMCLLWVGVSHFTWDNTLFIISSKTSIQIIIFYAIDMWNYIERKSKKI